MASALRADPRAGQRTAILLILLILSENVSFLRDLCACLAFDLSAVARRAKEEAQRA